MILPNKSWGKSDACITHRCGFWGHPLHRSSTMRSSDDPCDESKGGRFQIASIMKQVTREEKSVLDYFWNSLWYYQTDPLLTSWDLWPFGLQLHNWSVLLSFCRHLLVNTQKEEGPHSPRVSLLLQTLISSCWQNTVCGAALFGLQFWPWLTTNMWPWLGTLLKLSVF